MTDLSNESLPNSTTKKQHRLVVLVKCVLLDVNLILDVVFFILICSLNIVFIPDPNISFGEIIGRSLFLGFKYKANKIICSKIPNASGGDCPTLVNGTFIGCPPKDLQSCGYYGSCGCDCGDVINYLSKTNNIAQICNITNMIVSYKVNQTQSIYGKTYYNCREIRRYQTMSYYENAISFLNCDNQIGVVYKDGGYQFFDNYTKQMITSTEKVYESSCYGKLTDVGCQRSINFDALLFSLCLLDIVISTLLIIRTTNETTCQHNPLKKYFDVTVIVNGELSKSSNTLKFLNNLVEVTMAVLLYILGNVDISILLTIIQAIEIFIFLMLMMKRASTYIFIKLAGFCVYLRQNLCCCQCEKLRNDLNENV